MLDKVREPVQLPLDQLLPVQLLKILFSMIFKEEALCQAFWTALPIVYYLPYRKVWLRCSGEKDFSLCRNIYVNRDWIMYWMKLVSNWFVFLKRKFGMVKGEKKIVICDLWGREFYNYGGLFREFVIRRTEAFEGIAFYIILFCFIYLSFFIYPFVNNSDFFSVVS